MKPRYAFIQPDGSFTVTEVVPGTWREHRTVARGKRLTAAIAERLHVRHTYRVKREVA